MSVLAAAIVSSGEQVIGWVTMPASERLTMSTCAAWSSTERLRCRPPSSEEKPGDASITPTREGRKAPFYGRCEHRPGTGAAAYGGGVADDAPLDPFAGDPADPAAALHDDDDDLRPLSVDEREDVL